MPNALQCGGLTSGDIGGLPTRLLQDGAQPIPDIRLGVRLTDDAPMFAAGGRHPDALNV